MINYLIQDITSVESGIVAHGVNCQNTMNSGVAKAIREKYPQVYTRYMEVPGEYMLGKIDTVKIKENLYIVNCYTQKYYGREVGKKYANPTAIAICLFALSELASKHNLPIYIPKIGCGLGGLDWERVKRIVKTNALKFPNLTFNVCDLK